MSPMSVNEMTTEIVALQAALDINPHDPDGDDLGTICKTARLKIEEFDAMFDLYWKACQRGTQSWREGHPERDLWLPDTAKLVEWLIDRLDRLHAQTVNSKRGEVTLCMICSGVVGHPDLKAITGHLGGCAWLPDPVEPTNG